MPCACPRTPKIPRLRRVQGHSNTVSPRRTVGETGSGPESPAKKKHRKIYSREALGVGRAVARGREMLRVVQASGGACGGRWGSPHEHVMTPRVIGERQPQVTAPATAPCHSPHNQQTHRKIRLLFVFLPKTHSISDPQPVSEIVPSSQDGACMDDVCCRTHRGHALPRMGADGRLNLSVVRVH